MILGSDSRLALVLTVLASLSGARAVWVEPEVRAVLTTSANATGTQHTGFVVRYACAASGGLLATQTIYWRHQKGNAIWDLYERGRSELVMERAVELSDTNTALVCDVEYSSRAAGDNTSAPLSYRAAAPPVPLVVASGIPTTPAPTIREQTLAVTTNATGALHVGDYLTLGCQLNSFVSNWVYVYQVKDDVEYRLLAGRTHVLAAEDDGTRLYCQAYMLGYFLESPRITFTVLP